MQGYPEYGYKQESYVIVEEEKFVKENCVYDNSSSMQMMRPKECTPTPPRHHHTPPYHGGYYEGTKYGKEGYWPNDKEQHHHSDMGGSTNGGHHHAPPQRPPVVQNGLVKRYGDASEGAHRPYYYEHKKDVQCWSKGIDD